MTVEILERNGSGYAAIVAVEGELCEVSRRFGSWTTLPDDSGRFRDILPRYAAILQAEVRRLERAEISAQTTI